MAYINRSSGNARGATLAAVAMLHVAGLWAIANGLSFEYVREQILNLPTTNYPAEPPPQTQPEPPRPEPADTNETRITPADPLVTRPGTTVFALPPLDPPQLPDLVIPDPGPTFEPGPRFEPIGARPAGRPGLWVTTNDYPTSDIRQGNEGTVAFRLAIDAGGKATRCEIVRPSGHPGLDAATCAKLTQRARFEPARDASGARVAGSYAGTVRWEIPE